jgi:thiamine pyrophosphokinase
MRAVIFANGEVPNIQNALPLLADDDYIVSADGGLRYIRALSLIPKLVIGDLDSVSKEGLQFIKDNNIELLKFPIDKDQTDLELAVQELAARGYQNILVIGALGGRMDQTLANIGLISLLANQNISLELDDGCEHVFLIWGKSVIVGSRGDVISLIPICASVAGIKTTGLKYPLFNEELLVNRTRGISNQMTDDTAEISNASGSLLCIHTRKNLKKENK